MSKLMKCAACGAGIKGEPGGRIHRDGFCEGPEVPLCHDCGAYETPTCPELWGMIAAQEKRRARGIGAS